MGKPVAADRVPGKVGEKERAFDAWLVASSRIGDERAWQQLVTRWQPRLLSHAWRLLGDADQARDTVQDAWLDILRGLASLDDARAFPAWAFRIVSRRCARMIRQAQRRRSLDHELTVQGETRPEPNPPEQSTEDDRLRQAIRELPSTHRGVIGLFYLEGMSVTEVSIALEIPTGTVKTRLMHARDKLRETLEGNDNGEN